jgi:hypothetical protein
LSSATVLVAALGLISAPPARAETFKGQTFQHKPVVLRTNATGEVRYVSVNWRAEDCTSPKGFVWATTIFRGRPVGGSTPVRFSERGTVRHRFSNARLQYQYRVKGRTPRPGRWTGSWKINATVKYDDRKTLRCRLGPITWGANAV